jgi:hypothetical protein
MDNAGHASVVLEACSFASKYWRFRMYYKYSGEESKESLALLALPAQLVNEDSIWLF